MNPQQGLLLAVDTATAQLSVAIGGPAGAAATLELLTGRKHVESLAPAVDLLLREHQKDIGDVEGVAIDVGPGSYTGIRIGLAFARALGYGRNVPVIPVCSLDVLAWGARHSSQLIVAALDAYRHEVFFATYRWMPDAKTLNRIVGPTVSEPRELMTLLADEEDALLVGDAMDKYGALFAATKRITFAGPDHKYPRAVDILALTSQGEQIARTRPEPMYLREPYIHPKRRQPSP